jgi:hypothetical protein
MTLPFDFNVPCHSAAIVAFGLLGVLAIVLIYPDVPARAPL